MGLRDTGYYFSIRMTTYKYLIINDNIVSHQFVRSIFEFRFLRAVNQLDFSKLDYLSSPVTARSFDVSYTDE